MYNLHRIYSFWPKLRVAPIAGQGGPGGGMPPKAKNTASLNDLVKVIRGNVTRLDETKFASADPVIICENYTHFLTDLLAVTPRPIKSQIAQAVP